MGHEIASWREEKQSAYLYRVIASVESEEKNKKLFLELAEAAEKQANIWAEVAKKSNQPLPSRFLPDCRAKVVTQLIRWFGPRKIRLILAAMKVRGLSVYSERPPLSEGHPMPTSLAEVGSRHHGSGSAGNLRAAVFGINDGLISNAGLILGLAGAGTDAKTILLAGIAGCVAGAFSMASGEYLSVQSQKEMFEYQIGLEREELKQYPKEEAQELKLIYEARGLPSEEAESLSNRLVENPERGLDTLAREELGINPEDLVSPRSAAFFSFVTFLLGGIVPLLPFLFGGFSYKLGITILLTALSLLVVGSLISLWTGRKALISGLRMVLIGGGAGLITYFLGKFIAP